MTLSTLPKLAALSLALSSSAALAADDFEDSSTSKGPGFAVGLRAGYGLPLGNAVGAEEGEDANKLSDAVSGVIPLQLDVGYFINSHLYLGGAFQYGFGFLPEDSSESCDVEGVSCSVTQLRFGLNLAYHFAPDATVNPWVGVGVGYETLTLKVSGEANGVSASASNTAKGFEFANAQGGIDFALSPTFSVGPFVTFTVAQYASNSVSVEGIPGEELEEGSQDIENKAIHSWLYGGVRLLARF